MTEETTRLLVDALLATGLGLFIGLEREHAGDAEAEAAAEGQHREVVFGVRTFALVALLGWAAGWLGAWHPWVSALLILVTGALIVAQYLRSPPQELGLTTEIAAVLTIALGMLVSHDRLLAVALALGTTLLLVSKPWMRATIPKLRRVELTATLQLLILLAVVLPLLPTEARDPWGVLSPRKIGLFVTLIAAIGFIGYVLHRLFGASRGAGLSGIVGGLVSSTAVTAAMAQQARRAEAMVVPGQLATFLANTIMFARVLVVTSLISRDVARSLAWPLGAMGAVMLAGAGWKWMSLRGQKSGDDGDGAQRMALRNPFALLPALKWALILCAVLVLSAVMRDWLGDEGLLVTAAASGLADVDAITLTVSRDAGAGTLSTSLATLAITIAVMSNSVVKAGIALATGGARFGRDVAAVFGVVMAVGIAVAVLVGQ